jgi:hypothetical protein
MPRDNSWIDNLEPDQAQVAIDALDARKGPYTVREVLELRKLRLALQAKAEGR